MEGREMHRGRSEGLRLLEELRCTRENNIKIDVKDKERDRVD
jgi:hypothetical protein